MYTYIKNTRFYIKKYLILYKNNKANIEAMLQNYVYKIKINYDC